MNQQQAPLYEGRPTDPADPKEKENPTPLGKKTLHKYPFAAALGHFFFSVSFSPFCILPLKSKLPSNQSLFH